VTGRRDDACVTATSRLNQTDLLLAKPDVLLHMCLLISNLLLVLDQVLWNLTKFRLQCPPEAARPHVFGTSSSDHRVMVLTVSVMLVLTVSVVMVVCGMHSKICPAADDSYLNAVHTDQRRQWVCHVQAAVWQRVTGVPELAVSLLQLVTSSMHHVT